MFAHNAFNRISFNVNICSGFQNKRKRVESFYSSSGHTRCGILQKIFPVILTDRGSEFCNPDIIEFHHETGERLTNVFFCDSYSSYQKGAIEENHTLLRYILPKGTLFDDLTQEDVDLISSHINSYHRKSIDSTPYKLSLQFFGKDILDLLNLKEISPESVTLHRSLLK